MAGPQQSCLVASAVGDEDSILDLECARQPPPKRLWSTIDLTDTDSGSVTETEPDCWSTETEPNCWSTEANPDQECHAAGALAAVVEQAPAPSGDTPDDPLLAALVAPPPTPSTPSPTTSESFDSELTDNEDPCAPHDTTGGAIATLWHSDPSTIQKINDLVVIGVRERWLTRGCMDRTLGLEFKDAVEEAMENIARAAPSFGAFKVGITCDPRHRWTRKDKNKHGVVGHQAHFEGMDLVYVSPHSKAGRYGSAGHMERELIERCHEMWANVLNTLPGGEGAPRESPCFVYIAWRCTD